MSFSNQYGMAIFIYGLLFLASNFFNIFIFVINVFVIHFFKKKKLSYVYFFNGFLGSLLWLGSAWPSPIVIWAWLPLVMDVTVPYGLYKIIKEKRKNNGF